uniref:Helix-turn-helix domain-containing protein n=1 Tax=Staphylothermus marinus TaxID=2280 RepID=A0A7C4HA41_STAMA
MRLSIDLPVHWLSKDARFRIIETLLSTRTVKSLASELGVSRSAIKKYINRVTHPSDETISRVFEILAPYEKEAVIKIVIDDLIEAIKKLINNLDNENHREYFLQKIREIGGVFEKQ